MAPEDPQADSQVAGDEPNRYTEALRRFSGDLRMIKQVFESMQERGVSVREHQWHLLLEAHLDGRDLAGARDIMARMRAAGVEPEATVQWDVVVTLSRSGRTEEAMELVRRLEQAAVRPRADHAAAALGLFLAAGEFGRAKQALRLMVDNGLQAEPSEYQRLVGDCLRRRAINDTEDLVDLMIASGRPPTDDQANQLVTMMAGAGHPDRAVGLQERLSEVGVQVDLGTRSELLRAFAAAGRPDRAGEVLEQIRETGGEVTSFHANSMLHARLEAGQHEGAWETAVAMAEGGRIPSGRNLEGLLTLSLESGNLARAVGALDWMLMLGAPVSPDQVGQLVVRLLDTGELDRALRLFREAGARGVSDDRRAAAALVEGLVRDGRLGEARGFLHELRSSGTLTHGKHYGSLLSAYTDRGALEEAATLLEHMVMAGITPAVADAARVVLAVAKDGDPQRATALLDELVGADVAISEPTYRELMWIFARAGRYEPAKEVHDRMVAAGIEPDERHRKALEWASGETPRRLADDAIGDGAPRPPSPAEEALASLTGPGPAPPRNAPPDDNPSAPASEDPEPRGEDD